MLCNPGLVMALMCLRIPKLLIFLPQSQKLKNNNFVYLFSPMLKETEHRGRDEEGGNSQPLSLPRNAMTTRSHQAWQYHYPLPPHFQVQYLSLPINIPSVLPPIILMRFFRIFSRFFMKISKGGITDRYPPLMIDNKGSDFFSYLGVQPCHGPLFDVFLLLKQYIDLFPEFKNGASINLRRFGYTKSRITTSRDLTNIIAKVFYSFGQIGNTFLLFLQCSTVYPPYMHPPYMHTLYICTPSLIPKLRSQ